MKHHLTEKEEEIMQLFWAHEKLTVKEVIGLMSGTPLHFNTVSTFVRSLEQKGYLSHESYGQGYRYFAVISSDEYSQKLIGNVVSRFFNNSYKRVVNALISDGKLTEAEIEDLLNMIKKKGENNDV